MHSDFGVLGGESSPPYIGPTGGQWHQEYEQEWQQHLTDNALYWYYFLGDFALEEGEAPEQEGRKTGEPPPLKYPLGVRLVALVAKVLAGILLGEYDPSNPEGIIPIDFEEAADGSVRRAWAKIRGGSDLNAILLKGAIQQTITGGWWAQVVKRPTGPPWLVFRTASVVRPVWHPLNPERLLECSVQYMTSAQQARLLAGPGANIPQNALQVPFTETWTQEKHLYLVGEQVVKEEPNRLRDEHGAPVIPFVYFPRERVDHDFWGEQLAPYLIGLMLEINIRLRDLGDDVRAHSHPVVATRNTRHRQFSLKERVWDLGDASMTGNDPDAFVLEGNGVNSSAFELVNTLFMLMLKMASLTNVDVGEDEGSQRSGLTLEVRRAPGVNQARRTRAYWERSLKRLVRTSLIVYNAAAGELSGLSRVVVPELEQIVPKWAELVPANMNDVVNQITLLLGAQDYPRLTDEMIADMLGRLVSDKQGYLSELKSLARESRARREAAAAPPAAPDSIPTPRANQQRANERRKEES